MNHPDADGPGAPWLDPRPTKDHDGALDPSAVVVAVDPSRATRSSTTALWTLSTTTTSNHVDGTDGRAAANLEESSPLTSGLSQSPLDYHHHQYPEMIRDVGPAEMPEVAISRPPPRGDSDDDESRSARGDGGSTNDDVPFAMPTLSTLETMGHDDDNRRPTVLELRPDPAFPHHHDPLQVSPGLYHIRRPPHVPGTVIRTAPPPMVHHWTTPPMHHDPAYESLLMDHHALPDTALSGPLLPSPTLRSWSDVQCDYAAGGIAFPPDFPIGPFPDRDATYAALQAWAADLTTCGGAFAVTRDAYGPATSRKGPRQLFRCNRYGHKRRPKPAPPAAASTPTTTVRTSHTTTPDRPNRATESIKCNCHWAVYYEECDAGWVAASFSDQAIKAHGQHSHPLYQTVDEKNTNTALRYIPEGLGITADLLHERHVSTPQIYEFLAEHCRRTGTDISFVPVDIKNRLSGRVKKRSVLPLTPSSSWFSSTTTAPRPARPLQESVPNAAMPAVNFRTPLPAAARKRTRRESDSRPNAPHPTHAVPLLSYEQASHVHFQSPSPPPLLPLMTTTTYPRAPNDENRLENMQPRFLGGKTGGGDGVESFYETRSIGDFEIDSDVDSLEEGKRLSLS